MKNALKTCVYEISKIHSLLTSTPHHHHRVMCSNKTILCIFCFSHQFVQPGLIRKLPSSSISLLHVLFLPPPPPSSSSLFLPPFLLLCSSPASFLHIFCHKSFPPSLSSSGVRCFSFLSAATTYSTAHTSSMSAPKNVGAKK